MKTWHRVVISGAVFVLSVSGGTKVLPVNAQNKVDLLEVAERLLASTGFIDPSTGKPLLRAKVTVGALPQGFPKLPLPQGTRIVGSVARPGGSETVLDVPGSLDSVFEEFKLAFSAIGWQEDSRSAPGYRPVVYLSTSFYPSSEPNSAQRAVLLARPDGNGKIDIRISLLTGRAFSSQTVLRKARP